jgi:hypothetical protein
MFNVNNPFDNGGRKLPANPKLTQPPKEDGRASNGGQNKKHQAMYQSGDTDNSQPVPLIDQIAQIQMGKLAKTNYRHYLNIPEEYETLDYYSDMFDAIEGGREVDKGEILARLSFTDYHFQGSHMLPADFDVEGIGDGYVRNFIGNAPLVPVVFSNLNITSNLIVGKAAKNILKSSEPVFEMKEFSRMAIAGFDKLPKRLQNVVSLASMMDTLDEFPTGDIDTLADVGIANNIENFARLTDLPNEYKILHRIDTSFTEKINKVNYDLEVPPLDNLTDIFKYDDWRGGDNLEYSLVLAANYPSLFNERKLYNIDNFKEPDTLAGDNDEGDL